MSRDGRPPRRLAAIHSLDAWLELTAMLPKVASLREAMTSENISRSKFEERLEDALREISAQQDRINSAFPDHATGEAGLLSLTRAYQVACRDAAALDRLGAAVREASTVAEQSIQTLKNLIWAATIERPKLDSHVALTAKALVAAGLTTPVSRAISRDQLERIAEILGEEASHTAQTAVQKKPRMPVSVVWSSDNCWASLPKEIPGYRLSFRDVSPSEVGLAAVIRAGLPPYAELEEFESGLKFAAFKAAKTDSTRTQECWNVLRTWMRANNVSDAFEPGIEHIRKKSWVLLFSLNGKFSAEGPLYDQVRLPSPWNRNQVVIADRIE